MVKKGNELSGDPKCWECGTMVHPTMNYEPLRCEECKEKGNRKMEDIEAVLEGRTIFEWAEVADSLAFVLRDLVTDEEIGLNASGELWARARTVVNEYDAAACCHKTPCESVRYPTEVLDEDEDDGTIGGECCCSR